MSFLFYLILIFRERQWLFCLFLSNCKRYRFSEIGHAQAFTGGGSSSSSRTVVAPVVVAVTVVAAVVVMLL